MTSISPHAVATQSQMLAAFSLGLRTQDIPEIVWDIENLGDIRKLVATCVVAKGEKA